MNRFDREEAVWGRVGPGMAVMGVIGVLGVVLGQSWSMVGVMTVLTALSAVLPIDERGVSSLVLTGIGGVLMSLPSMGYVKTSHGLAAVLTPLAAAACAARCVQRGSSLPADLGFGLGRLARCRQRLSWAVTSALYSYLFGCCSLLFTLLLARLFQLPPVDRPLLLLSPALALSCLAVCSPLAAALARLSLALPLDRSSALLRHPGALRPSVSSRQLWALFARPLPVTLSFSRQSLWCSSLPLLWPLVRPRLLVLSSAASPRHLTALLVVALALDQPGSLAASASLEALLVALLGRYAALSAPVSPSSSSYLSDSSHRSLRARPGRQHKGLLAAALHSASSSSSKSSPAALAHVRHALYRLCLYFPAEVRLWQPADHRLLMQRFINHQE